MFLFSSPGIVGMQSVSEFGKFWVFEEMSKERNNRYLDLIELDDFSAIVNLRWNLMMTVGLVAFDLSFTFLTFVFYPEIEGRRNFLDRTFAYIKRALHLGTYFRAFMEAFLVGSLAVLMELDERETDWVSIGAAIFGSGIILLFLLL